MSMYDKTHYNIVISLQLIKINGKKKHTLDSLSVVLRGLPFSNVCFIVDR